VRMRVGQRATTGMRASHNLLAAVNSKEVSLTTQGKEKSTREDVGNGPGAQRGLEVGQGCKGAVEGRTCASLPPRHFERPVAVLVR
jgi:hypothetical protein